MTISFCEIFAVIFSLLCVILTIRRSVWCWAVGIVGVVFYAYVFYYEKLYADMTLQAVYFIQSVYGWLTWLKNGGEIDDSKRVSVKRVSMKNSFFHFLIAVVLWIITAYVMVKFTDNSMSTVDALLSVASLVANYYLAKRILESWYIWIVVDVAYVGVFIYKGLYLSAGLYALFFVMAIYGLIEWKKTLR